MKIEIDKPTTDYIREKGGIVNIDLFTSKTCCVEITEPIISYGIPKKIDQFDEYEIDDVKVFVCRFIHLKGDTLTIKLKSMMGIKNLSLTGIRLL